MLINNEFNEQKIQYLYQNRKNLMLIKAIKIIHLDLQNERN